MVALSPPAIKHECQEFKDWHPVDAEQSPRNKAQDALEPEQQPQSDSHMAMALSRHQQFISKPAARSPVAVQSTTVCSSFKCSCVAVQQ
jgi:hypothetical protein